jgi:hypothetical protein
MVIGFAGLLAAQVLGVLGLRHRGHELVSVVGMALLTVAGYVSLSHGVGL